MKKSLTTRETIAITSMLFGMFFGAGNLIFPAKVGIDAGANMWPAIFGVCVSAVGIPMLSIVALGLSKSSGLQDMADRVGKKYSIIFTSLLYLTIGPLFAAPRCASTSFAVGAVNLIKGANEQIFLALFSFLFFAAVLYFSLRPGKIMNWIGKFLNPLFLVFLGLLVIVGLLNPVNSIESVKPIAEYNTTGTAFFKGVIEGYNTLDAIAGLAFGILVIDVVKALGVKEPEGVAKATAKAGVFSCILMGIIYIFITLVCAQSADICQNATNGGAILGLIANHYFKTAGAIIMTCIVTLACLKTAIALLSSNARAFERMFPSGPNYNQWTIGFCIISFIIANLGLTTIVKWCIPVLMFLYPPTITLILLALFENCFEKSKSVYVWTTVFTIFVAIFDLLGVVNGMLPGIGCVSEAVAFASKVFPLYSLGLGWVVPAAIGFAIGLILKKKA
ncbi:MAG: branched-chain amino acid transport system II carrier protein [Phascolarctobacterium sp.]|nr:branched-chain amino acid transport system II carrier protein [Phascolarctobacterium sp.]